MQIRKPKGVGLELINMSCAISGIMLFLMIAEGAQPMQQQEFSSEFGHGTACLLRMTKFYEGTGRIVVADSAFSSVKVYMWVANTCPEYWGGLNYSITENSITRRRPGA
jgi:hypothetical protein